MYSRDGDAEFERMFVRLRHHAPFAAGFIDWVRRPSSRLIRIPLAILLILGGILSFLPVLGIWMLPLGLMILALDIRPLRRPLAMGALWVEVRWRAWRAKRRRQRNRAS